MRKRREPSPTPKSDSPVAWQRRTDELCAEHEASLQVLHRAAKEAEEKCRSEILVEREARLAAEVKLNSETQRFMEDIRGKHFHEIERRAHAEGRAEAMAEIWRRDGCVGGLIDSEGRPRVGGSGLCALSDAASGAGDGRSGVESPCDEKIATAALAVVAAEAMPGVDVLASDCAYLPVTAGVGDGGHDAAGVSPSPIADGSVLATTAASSDPAMLPAGGSEATELDLDDRPAKGGSKGGGRGGSSNGGSKVGKGAAAKKREVVPPRAKPPAAALVAALIGEPL